jgi:hypothetical protein
MCAVNMHYEKRIRHVCMHICGFREAVSGRTFVFETVSLCTHTDLELEILLCHPAKTTFSSLLCVLSFNSKVLIFLERERVLREKLCFVKFDFEKKPWKSINFSILIQMLCCCSHQLDLGKCSSLRWCLSLAHRAFFYILPSFVHLSLSERVSLLFLIFFPLSTDSTCEQRCVFSHVPEVSRKFELFYLSNFYFYLKGTFGNYLLIKYGKDCETMSPRHNCKQDPSSLEVTVCPCDSNIS